MGPPFRSWLDPCERAAQANLVAVTTTSGSLVRTPAELSQGCFQD